MSRAFVKEPDGADAFEELPERPVSPHPNYVTPHGLALIDAAIAREREALVHRGHEGAQRAEVTLDRLGALAEQTQVGRVPEHRVVSDGRLVVQSNNEGVPFVLANPDAPVSQGVRAIAASLSARLPSRQAVLARR